MINNIEQDKSEWKSGQAKTVTFVVTEDCQLRCRYCYLHGKNSKGKMDFSIAKKTIDFLLENKEQFSESAVVFDFIGGEPFIETKLIDQICDYFKRKTYETNHPWFNNYRFSFSTNGINYSSKEVQDYIKKNRQHVDIGITIDGTEEKHNLQRVYPNGKGCYNNVIKNIPLWLSQFPNASTKVTIAHDDLPYIKDSVLHIWRQGIKNININVVFENVWEEKDHELFENQLKELADEILRNEWYKEYYCSFFQRFIGKPLKENGNWCGAGKMLAVDHTGNFYPCVRFTQFSLANRKAKVIGNVNEGISQNKLRPYLALDLTSQSTEECIHCEVATGCAWCQGANYDEADSDTIYQRATYLCEMHKARVRANNYFWNKYDLLIENDVSRYK